MFTRNFNSFRAVRMHLGPLIICAMTLGLMVTDTRANVIGDFVWNDLNTNGLQNVGEPGLSGVIVTLYDGASNFVGSTSTDSNGFYSFTNPSNGVYFVGFIPPLGFTFTTNNVGADDNLDSDVATPAGFTLPFVFTGTAITNIDAGLYQFFPGIQITKLASDGTNTAADGTALYVTNETVVTYTYVITNTGNTALSLISVVDDVLFDFFGQLDCPDQLLPGESITFVTDAVITESVTNIGSVVAFPVDPKTCNLLAGLDPVSDDDDAVVIVVNPGYDILKELTSPLGRSAAVGETIEFTITITNTGDVDLATVPVEDTYDTAFISYVSAVPASDDNVNDGVINWADIGPLPIGASTTIVAQFTGRASTPDGETNTVVATPTTPPEFPPVPPRTNEVPYDILNPGFSLTKTLISPTGRAAAVGEQIVFSLTVVNTGDVDFVTLPLEDRYDTFFLAYDSSSPASDNNVNDGVINWTDIGPLPAGASTSVTATFIALASTDNDETNTVVASPTTPPTDPPVPPRTNEVPYDISNPAFSLVKTVVAPVGRAAAVGETITFSLTIANTGDVTLVTVPLVDTFDSTYLQYASAVPPADSVAPGIVSWLDVGPLPVGATTSVTVNLIALASSLSLPETNTVVASPTTPPTEPPVPPRTNEVPYEISDPNFAVFKTLSSPTVRVAQVGETVVFTLTVTNNGDVTLVTVPVTDTFDATYLAFDSAIPAESSTASGSVTWNNVGPLSPGATATIIVNFTALASTVDSGTETNVVVARPTTPPDEPPVPPRTNEVPYDISSPGFTVTKTVIAPSGRAAQIGETITFQLTVNNTGDVDFVTVPLSDTFDAAFLSFVSATPAETSSGAGLITWADVGPLPAGASTSVTVNLTALQSTVTSGSETNTVVASPTTPPDQPPVPPRTNDVPYDISNAGYSIVKTVTSPAGRAAAVGENIVFTITVANTGDVALVTVPLVDIYETAILSYVSSVPASDNNINDGVINWADIGPLPVGASTSVVATFTAIATTPNDRTNRVVATPTTPPDQPPVPPRTNEVPYDVSSPGYTITKTVASPLNRPAIVGEVITFRLTVANTGDVTLVTVPLSDTYDTAFLTFSNAVPPSDDTVNDGQINWANVGPLVPGASTSVLVRFIAAAPTGNGLETNVVVATPTTPPDEPPVPPKTNEVPYDIEYLVIGDTVWLDLNGNGQPDENLFNQGLNGVRVNLFAIENGATNLVAFRTTTNGAGQRGYYVFTNLPFATYFVQVDVTTLPAAAPTNGPNAGQIITLVPTTPLRYNVVIPPNASFLTADFGFISSDPTAVELTEFRAEVEEAMVTLLWSTATEINNMGFHLYRSSTPDGERVRITDAMVPGRGTGLGGSYNHAETAPLADGTYYYWLEDVEYDFSTREHGPLRVVVGEAAAVEVIGSAAITADGLVRISAATLQASGINPVTVDPQLVRILIDGVEVAALGTSYGNQFGPSDFFIAYVDNPESAIRSVAISLSGEGEPKRMSFGYVYLSDAEGDTWTAAAEDNRITVALEQAVVRSLITNFSGNNIWLLDVTDAAAPQLLLGADIVSVGGRAALYFSDPSSAPRVLHAISASAVTEIPVLDVPAE